MKYIKKQIPVEEKTAEQMFIELGYEKYKDKECIEYTIEYRTIHFNFIKKIVKIHNGWLGLTLNELKAINKQIEELGGRIRRIGIMDNFGLAVGLDVEQDNIDLSEVLQTRLESAKDLLEIQGSDGNWNHSHYMCGMYNGMELIIATLENREPMYRNMPQEDEV